MHMNCIVCYNSIYHVCDSIQLVSVLYNMYCICVVIVRSQQLQNEIHNFQSSVSRLKSVKDKLSQNIKFGATPTLDKDMARLEKDWSRIEGMVRVSLDMLWAEHSEWVEMRLKEMESIVSQGQGLLDCQVVFLKEYPVKGLMWCAAGQLLEVVQSYLTTHEVRIVTCCTCTLYKGVLFINFGWIIFVDKFTSKLSMLHVHVYTVHYYEDEPCIVHCMKVFCLLSLVQK